MKKLLLCITAALLLGWAWNALFNYALSPDVRFWNRCADATDAWNERLRAEQGTPCFVFGGGSETRTTIDPAYAQERYGMRVINAAAQGLYGGPCNAEYALSYLRAGDTLVFPLTAYGLDNPPNPSGLRFLFRRNGRGMYADGLIPCRRDTVRPLMAGDALALSSCFTKLLTTGSFRYRYETDATVHESGWMEVLTTDEQQRPAARLNARRLTGMGPAALAACLRLQDLCRAKGCKLVFRLHIAHANTSSRAREAMAALSAVRAGLCVLRDPRLGCEPAPRDFADTNNHLSAEGVRHQMDDICPALKNERYWTEEELLRELRWLGWAENGTPRRAF